jgi:hypothetical protein
VEGKPLHVTSSDDVFVAWASQFAADKDSKIDVKSCLFVTSDRELSDRLHKTGAVIAKPKEWLTYSAAILKKDTDKEKATTTATISTIATTSSSSSVSSSSSSSVSSNNVINIVSSGSDSETSPEEAKYRAEESLNDFLAAYIKH